MNTFTCVRYNEAIERGHMSIMGQMPVREHDHMRYCFLLGLYQLRFDKRAFKEMFGKSVDAALPLKWASCARMAHSTSTTRNASYLQPWGAILRS